MRAWVILAAAGALTSCATPTSGGWIDVYPGYCVSSNSLGRDSNGLTHVRASPSSCAHPWGHDEHMEFIFDCASVRTAPTLANGQLGAGYSFRSSDDDDWQRSDAINQDHVGIARFACGG